MDADAVVAGAPELALIDELAHTNAPGMRNEKRFQDIDEVLDAGVDVISTVNIQHLESLNDAIFELTAVRVRETFPDRILEEADEVVLVDLTPEALQERLRAGKIYPRERAEAALLNFFQAEKLSALRELALREVAADVEARRQATVLDPLSLQAVTDRVLALVTPEPRSQRILRRAWRSAERAGSELDALWVREPGAKLTEEEQVSLAALRRLASILGAHFIEEEGDDLVRTIRHVVIDRGTTYVLLGTPDESRRREIVRGSLVSALVAFVPGGGRARDREPRRSQGSSPNELARCRPARAGLRASVLAERSRTAWATPAAPVGAEERSAHARPALGAGSTRPCSTRRSESPGRGRDARSRVPGDRPPGVRRRFGVARAGADRDAAARGVERAALSAGVPVDARIEKGRSLTHALRLLWEAERFDRIIAPATDDAVGGFGTKELTWLLVNAPAETLVLKPYARVAVVPSEPGEPRERPTLIRGEQAAL